MTALVLSLALILCVMPAANVSAAPHGRMVDLTVNGEGTVSINGTQYTSSTSIDIPFVIIQGYAAVLTDLTPAEGYTLSGYSINGENFERLAHPLLLPFSDNGTCYLTVTFARNAFTVSFAATDEGGSLEGETAISHVTIGTPLNTLDFPAPVPDMGYFFSGWLVNGETYAEVSDIPDSLTVGDDITVSAVFAPRAADSTVSFALSSQLTGGQLSFSSVQGVSGTPLSGVTFPEVSGLLPTFALLGWKIGDRTYSSADELDNDLLIYDGMTVTALVGVSSGLSVSITVSAGGTVSYGEKGSLSAADGTESAEISFSPIKPEQLTLNAAANDGWSISAITVNGEARKAEAADRSAIDLRSVQPNENGAIAVSVAFERNPKESNRIAGETRIETAIEISRSGWEKADAVILANALNFADALAGTPLGYALDAPILLTGGKSLEASVAEELERLQVEKIYILGGSAAISDDISAALDKAYSTERIAGAERYETARKVAQKLEKTVGSFEQLFFVSGTGFADALSAGEAAALLGSPILYVQPERAVDGETLAYAAKTGSKNAVIIGGEKAVSKAADNALTTAGFEVSRIYGADRYETSLAVIKNYRSLFTATELIVATGENFPDALAGCIYAAKQGALLTLVGNSAGDGLLELVKELDPQRITALGGTQAVSEELLSSLISAGSKTEQ